MKKPAILILLLTLSLHTLSQNQVSSYIIDLGRFKVPISNNGVLGYGGNTNSPEPCTYDNIVALYSAGFIMTGYRENSLWLNTVFSSAGIIDYMQGTVGVLPNDPRNSIYVIKSDDPAFGKSWQDYKSAVQLGASYYDGDKNGEYSPIDLNSNGRWDITEDCPEMFGDITTWCVYNDAVPKIKRRFDWNEPEGIEIQQTVFGLSNKDAAFIRYRIINRGTKASILDSVIFSAWADFDIGDYKDDLDGCDTLLSLGYSYNFDSDVEFGINPPAIGVALLQGPYAYISGETFIDVNSNSKYDDSIDVAIDTAIQKNGNLIKTILIPGARNQKVTSITSYDHLQGIGDPIIINDNRIMRCYQKGFNSNCSKINVCTFPNGKVFGGVDCNQVNPIYWFSGDPVKRIGWINVAKGDQRIMVNTGEFTLFKDKPVDIWVAYAVGRRIDHLTSITKMKQNAALASFFYDDLPLNIPANGEPIYFPEYFRLYQNYPNPFNPATKIRFDIPKVGSRQSIHVSLKVYDLLGNEIAVLVDEEKSPGSYEVTFNAENLASGVYIYKIKTSGYVRYRKMILIR